MTDAQFTSLSRAFRVELEITNPGAILTGIAVVHHGKKGWKMLIFGIDSNGKNILLETHADVPVNATYARVVAYITSHLRTVPNNPKIDEYDM